MSAVLPNPTLLEVGGLPVGELAAFAIREGRRPRPIYTAHKWFARRLGSVFRSLLIGATSTPDRDFWAAYYGDADLRGLTVLDPFVGGGTSVVEATRLGATAIGVDVDPVACAVTEFEVAAPGIPDLRDALRHLQGTVGAAVRRYHVTRDETGTERIVLHHFWVQVVECPGCGLAFEAHPSFLLAEDAGGRWVICSGCGNIERRQKGHRRFRCGACGDHTDIDTGRVNYGTAECPGCGSRQPLIEAGRAAGTPPTWRLFALEALDDPDGGRPVPLTKRRFLKASDADRAIFAAAARLSVERMATHPHTFPAHLCGNRRSDGRLSAYGYQRWTDLFNPRQLLHLSLLAEAIGQFDDPVRRALAMGFSDHLTTNCMMTAYAAGWRRLTPLFSIRAFRHVPRPVEINPWCDGTGRGTFPNTVRKIMRAAEFARSPKEPVRAGGFKDVSPRAPMATPAIVCGTARDLSTIPSRSVDLVLTDPPYFDNIAYSELAEFFLPWLELVKIVDDPHAARRVAVESLLGRRDDGEATERYTQGLAAAFQEIARVLKPRGIVVFSFRHAVPDAWFALARAIASSRLRAAYFLPAPGEAGVGLHAHVGTGLWDAVFVLRRAARARTAKTISVAPSSMRSVEAMVDTWARELAHASLPFTAVDRLTLRQAGYVAGALGYARDGRVAGRAVALETLLRGQGK